ncbi:F-box/FBD/LRR-repeat protein At1g13570 isoform X2 [Lolium perenne]|uniref:F-box/FBD/LRR-repeat protein At1g13570 isoform X2 n=1 Tax=Lolium perenne TaxID=4522 RepID=UPI0021F64E35|nr:F-box/FBD/LRR-repeat protein At1g13570-like isoform X2 [Lolium perenne]
MPPRGSTKRRRGRGRATEAAAAAAAAADALLSLPPEVLDDILIRVGILDAVRTSALSRAWRRRWEELSSLDLCFSLSGDDEGARKGLGAVDGVLLRCPGRVQRFCADLDNTYAGRIHDWLRVISGRGVEILSLTFGDGFPALPSSVFSCGRITSLSLSGCSIPPLPPGFLGFPELRTLVLTTVRLHDSGEYQLEQIIATSPLLENLQLGDVLFSGGHVKNWVIWAPNLRHLMICSDNNDGWVLKELASLCSAEIAFSDFVLHGDFVKFLSGLVQVSELVLAPFNIPSNVEMLEILLCTFHNLKSLTLLMHFCKQPPIMLALCLLKSAPNLEKLRIEVVQMIGITWRPNEMSFIELILSKARLLHTLSISHGEQIVMSNEDALNELLRYKRASAEAQVIFKGKAEKYY